MLWIQTDDDNRILGVSYEAPEPGNEQWWTPVDLDPDDFEHGIDDYIWENGQLVESPREGGAWWSELHADERLYSPAEAIAAIIRSEPSIVAALPDEHLAHMSDYLIQWEAGATYHVGDIVGYEGSSWRCLTAHDAIDPNWRPGLAPSLWAKVLVPNPDIIPDWEQPDSTNPYMKGDKVRHDGLIWESAIDNNVWEPGIYGWSLATGGS